MSGGDDKVVPFGKYKGRPIIEVIESDPAYLQWLTAQDWFREKYITLHQTIINRGSEPEETPDHNALQVLFLDDEFCLRFCRARNREFDAKAMEKVTSSRDHATGDWAMRYTYGIYGDDERREFRSKIAKPITTIKMEFSREFEVGGVDVELKVFFSSPDHPDNIVYGQSHYKIEIKPTVGDDYPAVLRQMKRNGSTVLFLKDYTGQGATKEQFIKTFTVSEFSVVFLRDCQG